jgi:hypothetical protein
MRRMLTIIWHMLKKKQKYRYESPIKKGAISMVRVFRRLGGL